MSAMVYRLPIAWTSMMRASFALFMVGMTLPSWAQKPPEIDYLIRFAGPLSSVQEKYIHEVLQGHEPGLGIWVDPLNAQLKVRTHLPLDRAAIQSEWSPQGMVITELVRLNGGLQLDRSDVPNVYDGFPQVFDTGNPAADNAAYAAAKEAWIAAHRKAGEVPSAPVVPE